MFCPLLYILYVSSVSCSLVLIVVICLSLEYRNMVPHIFMSNIRRLQPIDNKNKGQQKIGKELDSTNPEDLPEYFDHSLTCSRRRNL